MSPLARRIPTRSRSRLLNLLAVVPAALATASALYLAVAGEAVESDPACVLRPVQPEALT